MEHLFLPVCYKTGAACFMFTYLRVALFIAFLGLGEAELIYVISPRRNFSGSEHCQKSYQNTYSLTQFQDTDRLSYLNL